MIHSESIVNSLKCLFLLIWLISCDPAKVNKESDVTITNQTLQKVLKEYIQVLSQKKEVAKVVTIDFRRNNDSIRVALINSYPDLNLTTLNAAMNQDDFQICFTGFYPMNDFYQVKSPNKEAKEILANIAAFQKNQRASFSEPLFWGLQFYNNNLINLFRGDSVIKK